ncbi:hypothetical protein Tco_1491426 [Tanacetum coccineum]
MIPNLAIVKSNNVDHFINNDIAYPIMVVSQSPKHMQLPLRSPRLQIMVISKWIEIWSLTQCGVKRVEDLQLGVESYQKKLNITSSSTICVSNAGMPIQHIPIPEGFIYQNKDKKNKLMRINELHKFNAANSLMFKMLRYDRLKRIRMEYLTTYNMETE